MLKKTNQKGFSIIEVLIVLAIAGLIMLVVFLAVPALRRNAANSGRDNDAAKVSAAVTDCLSNRNGITTNCDSIAAGEVDVTGLSQLVGTGEIFSYTGAAVPGTVIVRGSGAAAASGTPLYNLGTTRNADASNYVITYKTKCNPSGDGSTVVSSNTRDFTVSYETKTSSSTIEKCIGS